MRTALDRGRLEHEEPEDFCGIVVLGEAPGAEEIARGAPFVGRSGRLLDTLLMRAGIVRRRCLVCNVFRRRPEANDVRTFFASRRAGERAGLALATELPAMGSLLCLEEHAEDVRRLPRLFDAYRPKVVVTLGRTALWALTGHDGLRDVAGGIVPMTARPTIAVVPSFHPAYLLRRNDADLTGAVVAHLETARLIAERGDDA